jgi:hypothetical protein
VQSSSAGWCRRGGETIQRLADCVIGAVAIREDVPMLHSDADFEVLARHTELAIQPISSFL